MTETIALTDEERVIAFGHHLAREVQEERGFWAYLQVFGEMTTWHGRPMYYLKGLFADPTGHGYGTQGLRRICELADDYKVAIYLQVHAFKYGGCGFFDDAGLAAWYEKYGFERMLDDQMVREPQE